MQYNRVRQVAMAYANKRGMILNREEARHIAHSQLHPEPKFYLPSGQLASSLPARRPVHPEVVRG